MEDILRKLYEGKIQPLDRDMGELKGHLEQRRKSMEAHKCFLDKLTEEMRHEFMEIMDAHDSLYPFEYAETYIDGFKTGARMMLEILR